MNILFIIILAHLYICFIFF